MVGAGAVSTPSWGGGLGGGAGPARIPRGRKAGRPGVGCGAQGSQLWLERGGQEEARGGG